MKKFDFEMYCFRKSKSIAELFKELEKDVNEEKAIEESRRILRSISEDEQTGKITTEEAEEAYTTITDRYITLLDTWKHFSAYKYEILEEYDYHSRSAEAYFFNLDRIRKDLSDGKITAIQYLMLSTYNDSLSA